MKRGACHTCRVSHLSCDGERPCLRCIKRNQEHDCKDYIKKTYINCKNRQLTTNVGQIPINSGNFHNPIMMTDDPYLFQVRNNHIDSSTTLTEPHHIPRPLNMFTKCVHPENCNKLDPINLNFSTTKSNSSGITFVRPINIHGEIHGTIGSFWKKDFKETENSTIQITKPTTDLEDFPDDMDLSCFSSIFDANDETNQLICVANQGKKCDNCPYNLNHMSR